VFLKQDMVKYGYFYPNNTVYEIPNPQSGLKGTTG